MITFERLLFGGLSVFFLGLSMLILGFMAMKRRPILISPKTLRRGMFLVFLPTLIAVTFRMVVDSLNSDVAVLALAQSLLAMSILAVICTLLVFLITRDSWLLLNITEAIALEGLDEILQKHGIEHSLSQNTNPIIRLCGLSQVTAILSGFNSSIKVTLASFGRAWMRFKGRRRILNYDTLISDFRQALAEKDYDGNVAAFPLLFAAIVSMGVVVCGVLLAIK